MVKQFVGVMVLALLASFAGAAEIIVFCPGAVRTVVIELAQGFQAATGNTVKLEYGTACGL